MAWALIEVRKAFLHAAAVAAMITVSKDDEQKDLLP